MNAICALYKVNFTFFGIKMFICFDLVKPCLGIHSEGVLTIWSEIKIQAYS